MFPQKAVRYVLGNVTSQFSGIELSTTNQGLNPKSAYSKCACSPQKKKIIEVLHVNQETTAWQKQKNLVCVREAINPIALAFGTEFY